MWIEAPIQKETLPLDRRLHMQCDGNNQLSIEFNNKSNVILPQYLGSWFPPSWQPPWRWAADPLAHVLRFHTINRHVLPSMSFLILWRFLQPNFMSKAATVHLVPQFTELILCVAVSQCYQGFYNSEGCLFHLKKKTGKLLRGVQKCEEE